MWEHTAMFMNVRAVIFSSLGIFVAGLLIGFFIGSRGPDDEVLNRALAAAELHRQRADSLAVVVTEMSSHQLKELESSQERHAKIQEINERLRRAGRNRTEQLRILHELLTYLLRTLPDSTGR
jgi:hypothetical protein